MNGHRKEVINSSIILKLNQAQTKDSDEVTEAITKLQQNGVNCIVFTKNELLDLSNVKNGHHHVNTVVNVMQKTKEQQKLNDLLDYEPDIKSINSSLAIQLASNNNYHPTQKIAKRPKSKRRRKGKQQLRKRNSTANAQKSNNFRNKSPGKRANHRQEYTVSPYNLRRQVSSFHHLLSSSETEDNQSELNNGLSTPPPYLSPQYIQEIQFGEGFPSSSLISETDFENQKIEIRAECILPLLSPPISTFTTEINKNPPTCQVVLDTMEGLLSAVVDKTEDMTPEDGQCNQSVDLCHVKELNLLVQAKNPLFESSIVDLTEQGNKRALEARKYERSLPLINEDSSMKLRHSSLNTSFYSLVTNNVRYNLENYLDGRISLPSKKYRAKKRQRYKNGYLLCHGDNYPDNPELSYKLNLTTQILLKLNRKRFYKPKTDKRKTLLAYLNLVPKRPVRKGRTSKAEEPTQELNSETREEKSIFSGEWTLDNKYACGICKHEETYFWDMVTHKGEEHSGVLVTHVELPVNQEVPRTLIRDTAQNISTTLDNSLPACTKCTSVFSSYPELHRHIFECSGNTDWLSEQSMKKPTKTRRRRRQGFKRRLSNNSPKKNGGGVTPNTTKIETPSKRKSNIGSTTTIYKCKFCIRHFKTEGWLKNHLATHTLLVSIPLNKLPKRKISLPLSHTPQTRASNWSLRKCRAPIQ